LEIEQTIEQLEDLLETGSMLPWFGRRYVREEEFHRLVNQIRSALPQASSEASEITYQRERILNQAHEQAREILDQANHQALAQLEDARRSSEELVSQEHVVRQAHRNAEEILRQADQQAAAVRAETERWLLSLFARLDHEVGRVAATVAEARAAAEAQAGRVAPAAPPIMEAGGR